MSAILEARGLRKTFRRSVALDGLDLVARRGEVTCILGPNGAGKTTLIRMVATLLRPDAGELFVSGIDAVRQPERVRRIIGLAGQSAAVEGAMTGRENLELVARLFGHRGRQATASAQAVLARLGLEDDADRLVRTYSGGMRRKLDLGVSLVGAPEVLVLDEPTTGLDPRSRNELWACIGDLVAAGTDVLMTTQYLDEADHLAAHIAIVDHGRVIAEGSPDALKARGGLDVIDVRVARDDDLARAASALARLGSLPARLDPATRSISIPVHHGAARLVDAVRQLDASSIEVPEIALRRPTLDEVFLALTGTDDADADAVPEPAAPGRARGRRAA